ncbi:GreA/GreB family elongation factor [Nocardioides sp. 1609]|uniref:GreA/GreB family elongation factor n=1 Tax=Nocardioides sp. 1609 TaxID=2508327 RepID=UPI00106FDC2D|nr:GreA/GreB family elongation factor [Nocardioides sp. 1609]
MTLSASTAPTASTSGALAVLHERLTALQAERDQAQAETRAEAVGDIVDRATNVEASIRLSLLDERIAALELDIAEVEAAEHVDGVVSLGDTVVIDLGDGPESFVVGSVEQAVAGIETVTPSSPLGLAILGAAVGSTVSYAPRKGLSLSATIVSTS